MNLGDVDQISGTAGLNRRAVLRSAGAGFGALALDGLLGLEALAAPPAADPLAPRRPHHAPRAKRVIFLFMSGGPSHVDLFDPKPRLRADNGKPLPFDKPKLERTKTGNLLGSPWDFKRCGKSGIEVSELLPRIGQVVDDLCIVRSMVADNINHNGACLQMNTGEQAFSRPSMGSWVTYGLGSENENLPGFVVLSPAQPAQGAPLWTSSFLPAAYQGTLVSDLRNPIANLANGRRSMDEERAQLDALARINGIHRSGREDDSRLSARVAAFELAYRMQRQAPEAFDVERETPATKALYGLDNPVTETFGRQCLMARRLVERGVRFVQVYHTQTSKRSSCQLWDQHGGLKAELPANCASIDQPIAGLIQDLKAHGLLADTLVVWGG
ncbi:MAG: DUF1501 domain-containing protein, partial [Armatimonadota bacterium]